MTTATNRKATKKKRTKRVPTSTPGHWQHVAFRVRHTPDYLIKGTDHLELLVIKPRCQGRASSTQLQARASSTQFQGRASSTQFQARASSTTREALPITETGYLSHFVYGREVPNAKAALAFFLDWIAREAKSKRWQKADNKRRQLDLFTQS